MAAATHAIRSSFGPPIVFKKAMIRGTAVRLQIALASVLMFAACGPVEEPTLPDTAPFHYGGQSLQFPDGTVDGRIESGAGTQGGWARLMPNAPTSRAAASEPYYIDLGRDRTGEASSDGYRLGGTLYPQGSSRISLGDKYVMFCPPPERRGLAFSYGVLLRSLPRAAVLFRNQPSSPHAARVMVEQAEAYLTRAKRTRKPGR